MFLLFVCKCSSEKLTCSNLQYWYINDRISNINTWCLKSHDAKPSLMVNKLNCIGDGEWFYTG